VSAIQRNLVELNATLVARALARFVGAWLLVDRLGFETYGKMGWALTLVYVGVADDLGLASWAMRAAARDPSWFRTSAAGFVAFSLGVALARLGLLALALPLVCPDPDVRRLALGFALASLPNAVSVWWIHFARDRSSTLRNATALREAMWLAGVAALIRTADDLPRAVPLLFVCDLAESALLLAAALRAEGLPELRLRRPPLGDLVVGAVPMWASGRLFHLRAHVGTLVIGAVAGSAAVAAFDLAWRVAFNLWSLGSTSLSAMTPTLLRFAVHPDGAFWSLVRRGLRFAWVGLLVVPAVGVVAAGPLLSRVLGTNGAAVALPLALLLGVVVVAVLRWPLRAALFALKRRTELGALAALDAALLGGALLCARGAGAAGLAGGILAAEIVLVVAAAGALGRPLYAGAAAAGWRAALAGLVAFGATFAARAAGPLLPIAAGVASYLAMLWMLREPALMALPAILARRASSANEPEDNELGP
jgi:hypothetical protein